MKTLFVVLLFAATQAHAVTMAIIDSGTDLRHIDLINKAWINTGEINNNNKDDDGNGKVDDYNGWNFADNNNKVIDYSYLGTFTKDCYKFFEVQLRMLNGTATAEDKAWMKAKREDQDFITELEKFANFVHGTHVAGITAKDAPDARIMGIKLIPTEVKKPFAEVLAATFAQNAKDDPSGDPSEEIKKMLIKMALTKLAETQSKMLEPIGLYVWAEKARVANCSFGTSTQAIAPMLKQIIEAILKRELTPEELQDYASFFVSEIVRGGKQFAIDAKDTFFVIAAGNDGSNNDELPTYPANVKRANTIAVAATNGYSKLASFSNYGELMVDVAAPGVGIRSSIPGNEYLTVSGTSQAAPFVANVAGRILDTNPSASFAAVKMILMETSDKKEFMIGKVRSGGIVNPMRAVKAAEYSLNKSLSDAINIARLEVRDMPEHAECTLMEQGEGEGYVMPMPGLFY